MPRFQCNSPVFPRANPAALRDTDRLHSTHRKTRLNLFSCSASSLGEHLSLEWENPLNFFRRMEPRGGA